MQSEIAGPGSLLSLMSVPGEGGSDAASEVFVFYLFMYYYYYFNSVFVAGKGKYFREVQKWVSFSALCMFYQVGNVLCCGLSTCHFLRVWNERF